MPSKILVVDDEADLELLINQKFRKRIRQKELIFSFAENGYQALERLESEPDIDMVLTDINMPVMDGLTLLTKLEQLQNYTLKTVIVSAYGDMESIRTAMNRGAFDFLTKPIDLQDLEITIDKTLSHVKQLKKAIESERLAQEAEAKLSQYLAQQESERRLIQFLEAVPVGIFVLDANGQPYYANKVAQQLLGKGILPTATPEELPEVYQAYITGTNKIYPAEKQPILRALQGENSLVNDMELHQHQRIIPLEVWGTPIYDETGKIAYSIAVFQDITERKKAEAERQAFTTQLFDVNKAYERFVPRQFLQFLQKESIIDVQLGDQAQHEMSVLFSDIRGFTALSEKMSLEENFKFINSYLQRMEPLIIEHHGFIDKYIGDGIMALFSGNAANAVNASIAMLHELSQYNQNRRLEGHKPIKIGIGINTGCLMLGTVGGNQRMDGTVISDAVNLASRVESLTKDYGVSLLITHHTLAKLDNKYAYNIRLIDELKVKGKSELVAVYEVFDADARNIKEGKLATLNIFTEALVLYREQRLDIAQKLFQDCLQINPHDQVVLNYLQRCQNPVICL